MSYLANLLRKQSQDAVGNEEFRNGSIATPGFSKTRSGSGLPDDDRTTINDMCSHGTNVLTLSAGVPAHIRLSFTLSDRASASARSRMLALIGQAIQDGCCDPDVSTMIGAMS